MFEPRNAYRFAGVVLTVGAIAAASISEWLSLAAFALAASLMFWISMRVDRWIERRSENSHGQRKP